ncbi:hypothetical protein JTE90_019402 [Oedothorax gibbosus]|uniref:Uncharacterized protein n=1 Tax=Oedothorax gibbosus TaxID=931172 RepID=A0AAV6TU71_9ARAC|nr:hypothetical protein JTE90_019402 [Oedothorax gibbosus]
MLNVSIWRASRNRSRPTRTEEIELAQCSEVDPSSSSSSEFSVACVLFVLYFVPFMLNVSIWRASRNRSRPTRTEEIELAQCSEVDPRLHTISVDEFKLHINCSTRGTFL